MSLFPKFFSEPKRDDTIGFFVFDWHTMESYYGKQAFNAIYAALRSSWGVCVFYDGDIFKCEIVRQIAQKANLVTPSSPKSPLADLKGPFQFGAYFAAMWTDTYSNFSKVHSGLVAHTLPGYLGYMTLAGKNDLKTALYCFSNELHLFDGALGLRGGAIVEDAYGVGT